MKINKSPSVHEVRRFCMIWALAAVLMGSLLFWRHHPVMARALWMSGAVVFLFGIGFPYGARYFYRTWMALAFGIHMLLTRLLLALIFWGFLTPLALVFKLIRRDALQLKKPDPIQASYWQKHESVAGETAYRHLY